MKSFAIGLFVGLAIGGAATWLALRPKASTPTETPVVAEPSAEPAAPAGKKKKGRGGKSTTTAAADEPEASAPPVLGPADLAQASEGDALRVPPRTMDLAPGAEEPRDLSKSEIDGAIAAHADGIGECITRAAGDAELAGKVIAGVVVSPEGRVTKTRVEAPKYLLGRGLGSCVRGILRGMEFPATGKATIVRYPFHVS